MSDYRIEAAKRVMRARTDGILNPGAADHLTELVVKAFQNPVNVACENTAHTGSYCHACLAKYAEGIEALGASFADVLNVRSGSFVICPECGNKRCPKATWHGHVCTDSNAPGQAGSVYGLLHAGECNGCAGLSDDGGQ